MEKLIPADTVDADGNVWEAVGENIRNGAREYYELEVKKIVDIMFPVGSIVCGENTFIMSVGTWKMLDEQSGKPIISGSKLESGNYTASKTFEQSTSDTNYTVLRLFKRIM